MSKVCWQCSHYIDGEIKSIGESAMSIYKDCAAAHNALENFISTYAYMIREVRRLCVETLRMASDDEMARNYKDRDCRLEARAAMAYEILDILELEVDHWFCGTPILEDKQSDKVEKKEL